MQPIHHQCGEIRGFDFLVSIHLYYRLKALYFGANLVYPPEYVCQTRGQYYPPTNNIIATVLEGMWRGFLISTNLLFNSLNHRVGKAANRSSRFSVSLLVSFSIPKSSISEYLVRFGTLY